MPRLLCLFGTLLIAALAADSPASIAGKWKLLSMEESTRGETIGNADFQPDTANFQFPDGTKVSIPYKVNDGMLTGQQTSDERRRFSVLRGRYDPARDTLTLALIVRHLDNASANRSYKANCARVAKPVSSIVGTTPALGR